MSFSKHRHQLSGRGLILYLEIEVLVGISLLFV